MRGQREAAPLPFKEKEVSSIFLNTPSVIESEAWQSRDLCEIASAD